MQLEAFIATWEATEGGAERANYTRFLDGLVAVLELPPVPVAARNTVTPDYGYEARVSETTPHGEVRNGRSTCISAGISLSRPSSRTFRRTS